jgi:hypothetical protein
VSFSLPAGNHSRLPFSVLLLVMSSRALAWLHDVVVRNRRPRGSCTAGFFGGWQQRSPPVARPMLLLLLLLLLCSGARAQQLSKTVNNSVELREAIEGVLHPQFPTGIETIWVAPGIYNYSDAHSDATLLNVQSEGYVYKCEVAGAHGTQCESRLCTRFIRMRFTNAAAATRARARMPLPRSRWSGRARAHRIFCRAHPSLKRPPTAHMSIRVLYYRVHPTTG